MFFKNDQPMIFLNLRFCCIILQLCGSFFFMMNRSYALEARWLGVSNIFLTDGKTSLMFDAAITKPGIMNWIFNTEFVSDESLVLATLAKNSITHLDGQFISHTHFDHAVDAPFIAFHFKAPFFGGEAVLNLVSAYEKKYHRKISFEKMEHDRKIKIGAFTITPILRDHPAIFSALNWYFLPESITTNFNFSFYDYKVGETWCYYIEHPEGNILIDQSSHFHAENIKYQGLVQTYFVGIANKISLSDLTMHNINLLNVKKVVPMHFDFFPLKYHIFDQVYLPGMQLPAIKSFVTNKLKINFLIPTKNQVIKL